MSQKIEDKADAAEARTHETRGFMQQVRVAASLERELLRALGYINVPKRLMSSPLMKKASQLRASTDRLPRRGLYKIASETSGDDHTTVEEDKQLVRTLKTQRYRVKNHLGRYTRGNG